jgi:hypothetical protein
LAVIRTIGQGIIRRSLPVSNFIVVSYFSIYINRIARILKRKDPVFAETHLECLFETLWKTKKWPLIQGGQ